MNGEGNSWMSWSGRDGLMVRCSKVALLLVVACNLLLLFDFVFLGYVQDFNSDAGTKNLLAQEMYESRSFFPPDWTYVNGDLMVVFGQLFILPFLPFASNGFSLHAISGALTSLLVLSGMWLAVGIANPSRWVRLLCIAVFASGISWQIAEQFYGQGGYGVVFYLACFMLFLAWRFLHAQGRKLWLWGALMGVIMTLAFWSNAQRAAASYALPLMAAIGATLVHRAWTQELRWDADTKRALWLVALVLVSGLLGAILHAVTIGHVNNVFDVGLAKWLPFSDMVRNLKFTLQGLLDILGAVPSPGGSILSLEGAYQAIRMLAGITALVLIVVGVIACLRDRNPGLRFIASFTAFSCALFFFLQCTTTIPSMVTPEAAARYLVPSLAFGLLVVFIRIFSPDASPLYRFAALMVSLVLMTSAVLPSNILSHPTTKRPVTAHTELVRALQADGLRYGYATYWNAGAPTVLSGGNVRIRQIRFADGLPRPMLHLASENWYRPKAWSGETFLALKDDELAELNLPLLASLAGEPVRIRRFGDFNVLVYARNFAETLPLWDDEVRRPRLLTPSTTSLHTVGELLQVGSASVLATKGQPGFLHFGPYIRLEQGQYAATFDIEVLGQAGPGVATLDVSAKAGSDVRVTGSAKRAGRQRITLPFDLPEDASDLEFRVLTDGSSELRLYGIQLQRRGPVAGKPPRP
ncbi:hypothetical protein JI752_005790 [Lysobacter sp. MMG2]|uniref:hypothetical protein n=1 Tax=Lysobacter sp. MMG2 TaxID=2801338 RepID=UPI001C23FBCC|nr:hypothetical protein [Lysobacter sp. MMG2]MBU8975648.1 hypothetical protein [Lysobacter sp. MMG2]